MDNKAKDHKSIAMRVSVVSMIINTILSKYFNDSIKKWFMKKSLNH